MRLLTYRLEPDGQDLLGVTCKREREYFYPLEQFGVKFRDMNDLIVNITPEQRKILEKEAAVLGHASLRYDRVIHRAPIPHPRHDIICLGINYLEHAAESSRYKKEAFGGERPYAVYFSKRVNEAVADGDVIPSYKELTDSLDYEAELAVIIGKDAKNVSREEAFDYVFGYTIMNDVSARDVQTRHQQWYFGKSLDGFTPMGPVILTADEVASPPVLGIKSRVNTELRQNSSTDRMIFDIPHVIEELSAGMVLEAGSIISMGTPSGVGMGFVPPRFLKPGDVVECKVQEIGTLRNIVK
ncbi:MAG: fumarylacetoacetate hydrolase family protein [Lachnospiraceae bacterium]|jgi:2-keto-4-pentenoate hydratase/2-oxohepta-3-ene-1,7-dioic acid hydratase in catechol pathway